VKQEQDLLGLARRMQGGDSRAVREWHRRVGAATRAVVGRALRRRDTNSFLGRWVLAEAARVCGGPTQRDARHLDTQLVDQVSVRLSERLAQALVNVAHGKRGSTALCVRTVCGVDSHRFWEQKV